MESGEFICAHNKYPPASLQQNDQRVLYTLWPFRIGLSCSHRSKYSLIQLCLLVENAFLHLKRWRGIATRYAKSTASFLPEVQIRCVAIWCVVSA